MDLLIHRPKARFSHLFRFLLFVSALFTVLSLWNTYIGFIILTLKSFINIVAIGNSIFKMSAVYCYK